MQGLVLLLARLLLQPLQPLGSSGSPEDARQITPWKMNCQDHPEFSPDGKLVLFRCLPEGDEGRGRRGYLSVSPATGRRVSVPSPACPPRARARRNRAAPWWG